MSERESAMRRHMEAAMASVALNSHTPKNLDRTCLSYWFPRLAATGVSVPRTEIVRTNVVLGHLLDGKEPEGFAGFLEDVGSACERIGYPCFFRTGQTSAKHYWKDTCHLTKPSDLRGTFLN